METSVQMLIPKYGAVKKCLLSLLFLFFGIAITKGQVRFYKVIGHPNNAVSDFAHDMVIDNDQNIYLAHYIWGFGDYCITKINDSGQTLWSKGYFALGGTPYHMIYTNDEHLVILGATYSSIPNYPNLSVLKTDTSGQVIWSRFFAIPQSVYPTSAELIELSQGGFLLSYTCIFYDSINSEFFNRSYIMKLDTLGMPIWKKNIAPSQDVIMEDIKEIAPDRYLLAGSIDSIGFGGYDILMAMIDSSGSLITARIFGYTSDDESPNLAMLPGGDIMVLATIYDGFSPWLIVPHFIGLDSSLNVKWNKRYISFTHEQYFSCTPLSDSNFILASGGNMFRKIDTTGNTLWMCGYGNTGYNRRGKRAVEAANGDLFCLSEMYAEQDVVVCRTDSQGVSGCLHNPLNVLPWTTQTLWDSTITNLWIQDTLPMMVSNFDSVYALTLKDSTYCSIPIGIEEDFGHSEFTVYPNPSSGPVTLGFPAHSIAEIELYNLYGQRAMVYRGEGQQTLVMLDLSSVSDGMYLIRCRFRNGQVMLKKLTIVK